MLLFVFYYASLVTFLFFFFSSRRWHTRCGRDWSSDVCSSDLPDGEHHRADDAPGALQRERERDGERSRMVDRRRRGGVLGPQTSRAPPRVVEPLRRRRGRDRADRPEGRERRRSRDGLPPRRRPAGGLARDRRGGTRRAAPGPRRAPRAGQRCGGAGRCGRPVDGGIGRARLLPDHRDGRRRSECDRLARRAGAHLRDFDGTAPRHRASGRGDPRRDRRGRRPPSPSASGDLVEKVIHASRRSAAVFVTHPLLRRGAVEERAYQVNIARACLERSTLVVLPTGMGKTVVAAMVIGEVLRSKGGKILFLAPTKPLVEQHAASLRDMLVVDRIELFTGEATAPEDRELMWRENKIIVSTPQVIRNDVRAGRISLEDVSLIVFDEAHRAVGDYA